MYQHRQQPSNASRSPPGRGEEPVEMPLLGGSLPAAYFRDELDVPVLVVPYANPDQRNHSPNEHLDFDCLRR